MNTQKPLYYTKNEQSKKEIKETMPCTVVSKRIKIPRSKFNSVGEKD